MSTDSRRGLTCTAVALVAATATGCGGSDHDALPPQEEAVRTTVTRLGAAFERDDTAVACGLIVFANFQPSSCERFQRATERRLGVPSKRFLTSSPEFGDIRVRSSGRAQAEVKDPPRRVQLIFVSDRSWRVVNIEPLGD